MSSTIAALEKTIFAKGRDDPIKALDSDADPQTVFYLNPVGPEGLVGSSSSDGARYLQQTLYLWATRIESTVSEKLKTPPNEHGSARASWNRASFRSKLLDNLMRSTPWMAMRGDAAENTGSSPLTGNYNHDKRIFRDIVMSALQDKGIPINNERLAIIPNYISEAMTLAADTLEKVQRFAILLPDAGGDEMSRGSMKLVVIGFERAGSEVKTSNMGYEAILNGRLFEDQKLDENVLSTGKAIVQRMTVDYVT
ncbi:uncharacterized protein EKO05_0010256 [Ascochyta rabiei]|uniref:Uncharacterized protein n=1 Tax=Didymella rabiei TaxID=5454 RepID=A0A163F1W3_DIDRA|nr:uncharacterized protein EKO05_0010256 [Ascochyta rabiei]KZM24087.1 hypothetical protein ST47_g4744 [Ascochyta rabiei]UPX20010.1 hypothetical protein EKO05_0010256 [Ascochyta rabiei]